MDEEIYRTLIDVRGFTCADPSNVSFGPMAAGWRSAAQVAIPRLSVAQLACPALSVLLPLRCATLGLFIPVCFAQMFQCHVNA